MSIMSRIVTGDGIDITSSQDVEVKNCFIRSTDDSICIKSQRLFEDPSTVRDVTKVRVHNNVIWNAEPGNAIELGYALQSEIHDLVFEDCDIIHCQYEGNMGGAALSIHQADGGHVHDIHAGDFGTGGALSRRPVGLCTIIFSKGFSVKSVMLPRPPVLHQKARPPRPRRNRQNRNLQGRCRP